MLSFGCSVAARGAHLLCEKAAHSNQARCFLQGRPTNCGSLKIGTGFFSLVADCCIFSKKQSTSAGGDGLPDVLSTFGEIR